MNTVPPVPPSDAGRGRRGAFTLIEMLLVVGIIGLMLGIAIPFFQGIGQGTRLDAATRELHYTLLFARQHAITRRERVFVVFPNTDTAVPGVSVAAYRSYAVCTTNEFIREWAFLPPEVVFDPNYPNPGSANNLFRNASYRTANPSLWSGNQPALVFRTDGSLDLRTRYPEIALGQGQVLAAGEEPFLPGPTRNKIQVYGFTGMPQVMRLDDAL